MDVNLNDAEKACAKRLAELYEQGHTQRREYVPATIGLTLENCQQVLGTMEHVGAIAKAQHSTGRKYIAFEIMPAVVQIARDLERQEREPAEAPDYVDDIMKKARSSRIVAYIIIGSIAAAGCGGIATVVEKVVALLDRFGVLPK